MSIERLDIIIQKTLPLVYDDSLSYLEFLAKVIAKVNEAIDELNIYLNQDLQSYVEKKLIEWKNDGTLDTMIADAVLNIGDRQYTEQNYINSDETITESLDALDVGVTSRLAQTEKKIESGFVNIALYGAVADYLLEDGTINPNPTDNSEAISLAFSDSRRVQAGNDNGRGYYFSEQINLPASAELDLNGGVFYFKDNGLNLGSHNWNIPKIYGGGISGINKTGLGLYYENGYVVHPEFDLSISDFDKGAYFESDPADSNLTWGKINLKIQRCNKGLHLVGGWANTVEFERLFLHTIKEQAVLIENCKQLHAFIIKRLEMEQCAKDEEGLYSPFHVVGSYNGEITIYDAYIEGSGYYKSATVSEANDFKLNGVKVPAWSTSLDTKSWELNGKVYSEDVNTISTKDLNGSATFRFDSCRYDLNFNIKNMYITTNLLGIASFNLSPIKIIIDVLHLTTMGYSFPNMRKVFENLTPESPVRVISNRLTNIGGGQAFNYGDVKVEGDLFGGVRSTITFKNENYIKYSWANTITLPQNATSEISFTNSNRDGGLKLIPKVGDSQVLIIPETGTYLFSYSFVTTHDHENGLFVGFEKSYTNRTGQHITMIVGGVMNTLMGSLFLEKGDELKFKINNLNDPAVNIVGSSANANFLIIQKIN